MLDYIKVEIYVPKTKWTMAKFKFESLDDKFKSWAC